jgi:hypothetical protein
MLSVFFSNLLSLTFFDFMLLYHFAQIKHKVQSWLFTLVIHFYGSLKECLKHVLPCYKHKMNL